jgi:hypothetical protein
LVVVTLDRKFRKLPVVRPRYYKTDDLQLQDGAKRGDPDTSSLWPDARKDRAKSVSIDKSVLENLGVAAERSCMAINYFEFFAAVMKMSFTVPRDNKSSEKMKTAALDLADRARASMGRCLIDVNNHQEFILTSSTITCRDAVLQQHKSDLPSKAANWMRAQPILTGKSLFGQVSERVKPYRKNTGIVSR